MKLNTEMQFCATYYNNDTGYSLRYIEVETKKAWKRKEKHVQLLLKSSLRLLSDSRNFHVPNVAETQNVIVKKYVMIYYGIMHQDDFKSINT